ncbi:ribonucleoside-triphosphate reductase [Thermococcus celer]|uniref:Ribonucleoside-triphosphate reductase n=1 Tax=Thermococcus celer Vu 13 = JCM 8558 TaxID=1293037 RepID=A0A218P2Z8_THECE|nr:ribonucleoside-triphosphate reductase [Thermococcus celer]ASI99269.1 ribonucleoside-triphosphate reductase [Thermococcus celer Vu 13 = JCM 8558]
MEFEDELVRNLESEELWTVVTFKTPYGPGGTLQKLIEVMEKAGWRVTFRANWWTSDIPYGLARIDARKGNREKILLGKWVLGSKLKLIRVENMPLKEGRDEFFRMVDSITSTLIYDPVIRTMREQY